MCCYCTTKRLLRLSEINSPFGNVVLVMLFKCYGNICKWKSVVEKRVVLYKQWKLLFKKHNQTDPKSLFGFTFSIT